MSIIGNVAGMAVRDAVRSSAPAHPVADRVTARLASVQQRVTSQAQVMAATTAVGIRPQAAIVRQREPVDGTQVLGYARQFLTHFAVWPSEAALTAATLWAAHTHARDATSTLVFLSSPRMLFSSAEPGSGKSHAMKLVSRLCPAPAVFTEPSEPALAHSIGKDHATVFLDEADVLFGQGSRKAAMRALINDGYTPDGEWARVRSNTVDRMSTYGALALAGLDKVETATGGQMAATLSRCIRIRMRRAPEDYRAPRFDGQARLAAQLISERLGMWAQQELARLGSHIPGMPEGIGNRPAELWEPLLSVADIAGGLWPDLAREACEELVATGGMPPEDYTRAALLDGLMAGLGGLDPEGEELG